MASIGGALSKRYYFYPIQAHVKRGVYVAAGDPVRLVANPHNGAPIAHILRDHIEYAVYVAPADIVGGWDAAAAEYGRQAR
jgi:hypothetical protein